MVYPFSRFIGILVFHAPESVFNLLAGPQDFQSVLLGCPLPI